MILNPLNWRYDFKSFNWELMIDYRDNNFHKIKISSKINFKIRS
jgi:hypothetical protein